jgi:hypothetical protein
MPFVDNSLSPAYPKLEFYHPSSKIKRERDQGQAAFVDLPGKTLDLLFVHQQLASSTRLVIVDITEFVGCDMQTYQPKLAVVDLGIGIAEGETPFLHRLHFGSAKFDAALQGILDRVVVSCLPVEGENFPIRAQGAYLERMTRKPRYGVHQSGGWEPLEDILMSSSSLAQEPPRMTFSTPSGISPLESKSFVSVFQEVNKYLTGEYQSKHHSHRFPVVSRKP